MKGEERKTLDAETAVGMWGLVLVHHFALLPTWSKRKRERRRAKEFGVHKNKAKQSHL